MAPDGISQNSNDNSVVIRLVNGNNSFMFMGDAEETSEQDMISTGMNLDCDVSKPRTPRFGILNIVGSSGSNFTVMGSDQLRS